MGCALGGQVAGQPEDRSLGRAVARQLGNAAEHGLRRRVDDASVTGLDEVVPGRLEDEQGAEEVDVEHSPELVHGEGFEASWVVDTCVVDDGVDPTEGVDGRSDDGGGARFIGDGRIARHRFPTARPDLGHHVVGRREGSPGPVNAGADVGHNHARALRCEQQRVAPADAAPGAGHDHRPTVEAQFVHDLVSDRCGPTIWFSPYPPLTSRPGR